MPLALYTVGLFFERAEHPSNDGFHALGQRVFAHAGRARGMLAHSGNAPGRDPDPFGPEVLPEAFAEQGHSLVPATLSLWEDLESPFAFSYSGVHAEALRRAREWIKETEFPGYVLWWHLDEGLPTWPEAVARHKLLHDHGPAPEAFTFRHPFAPDGVPTAVDRDRSRALRR